MKSGWHVDISADVEFVTPALHVPRQGSELAAWLYRESMKTIRILEVATVLQSE